MGAFEQFPLLTLFVIVVAVLLIGSTVTSRRRPKTGDGPAECPQCGATPPRHAKFCNRCGQKL